MRAMNGGFRENCNRISTVSSRPRASPPLPVGSEANSKIKRTLLKRCVRMLGQHKTIWENETEVKSALNPKIFPNIEWFGLGRVVLRVLT
jgi:hypothetical protein